MIPALNAGTTYFQKTGTAPATNIRWKYAFYFTGIQIALASIILSLFWNFIPELSAVFSALNSALFVIFVLFYILIVVLVSRLFFGMGINTIAKTTKKL
jgi:hypothetical protein